MSGPEPHCAHCRQTRDEHDRRISEYEMHMHLWQPSKREWLPLTARSRRRNDGTE